MKKMWCIDICRCLTNMTEMNHKILFLRLLEHMEYMDFFILFISSENEKQAFLSFLNTKKLKEGFLDKLYFIFYQEKIPYEKIENIIDSKKEINKNELLLLFSDWNEIVSNFLLHQIKRSSFPQYILKVQLLSYIYSFEYLSKKEIIQVKTFFIPSNIFFQYKKSIITLEHLRNMDFPLLNIGGWKLIDFDIIPTKKLLEYTEEMGNRFTIPSFAEEVFEM